MINKPPLNQQNYYQGDNMSDQSRKIEISGGNINASGSAFSLGDFMGTVNNTINQLPASPHPDQPGIKELLKKLTEAIKSDTDLSDKNKAKALKQVQTLAEAGQNPNDEDKKNLAEDAITMLKGIITGVPAVATCVAAFQQLLPLITSVFGLP